VLFVISKKCIDMIGNHREDRKFAQDRSFAQKIAKPLKQGKRLKMYEK